MRVRNGGIWGGGSSKSVDNRMLEYREGWSIRSFRGGLVGDGFNVITGQLLTTYRVREGHNISTADNPPGAYKRG